MLKHWRTILYSNTTARLDIIFNFVAAVFLCRLGHSFTVLSFHFHFESTRPPLDKSRILSRSKSNFARRLSCNFRFSFASDQSIFFLCKRISRSFLWISILCFFPGLLIGFLPAMVTLLRGGMNARQCWFILMLPEYVLSVTIIGVMPIGVVIILYGIILYKALKKVSELKQATSGQSGTEAANNLRYFRGSEANLSQLPEVEPAVEPSTGFCCWKSKRTSDEALVTKRQPSKWRAIKIVFLTTGSFVITWVPYFIGSTMYVYCDQKNNAEFCQSLSFAVASPLAILGFANSLLNPIIYAWWHNGFRTNATRLLSKRIEQICCCCKTDEIIASPRTTNLTSTTNLSTLTLTASPTANST